MVGTHPINETSEIILNGVQIGREFIDSIVID
jgi:hypothetical protein